MVQVTEKFVEAVYGRQVLVQVTQMVLAELRGFIAERLQHGGQRHGLIRDAHVGSGLTHRRETRADRQLASDEVGATRRAACLGVVVGKQHTLRGELVEVRRLAGHHAAVVGADVEPADVIAHDDDDVGFLVRRLCRADCR